MFEKTTAAEAARALDTDAALGLTRAEAERRLLENGKNALAEKKPKTVMQMFFEQLNEPMIYILLAAAAISIFLKEYGDAVIVLIVIVLNAVIGVVQEGKAQQALAALKKLSSPTALVKREGEIREIPAEELVLGDLVVLEAGRQVPADLRLTFSTNLKIEESALTGESVPVEKDAAFTAGGDLPLGDRLNMAYMTTAVTYGRGEGIVSAAGMDTEIG
ncbi:MAG TPA: HAD-IC family P-type ATPase, partial [Clostridia bacterium]|nr:HAD-IC family P-type ATPase [Clostridia bacterium]